KRKGRPLGPPFLTRVIARGLPHDERRHDRETQQGGDHANGEQAVEQPGIGGDFVTIECHGSSPSLVVLDMVFRTPVFQGADTLPHPFDSMSSSVFSGALAGRRRFVPRCAICTQTPAPATRCSGCSASPTTTPRRQS